MKPVTTLEELDSLDSDLMLEGYRAGLGFIPINYTRKDKAYWHGYLNGQADRGEIPVSQEQRELCRKLVERGDFLAMLGVKQ